VSIEILSSDRDRVAADVGRPYLGIRDVRADRDRDRACSASDVGDQGTIDPIDKLQRNVDERFCLRTRNERTGTACDLE
jgi:hypothetical protein